ncbi:MAG: polysaccharide deacetylase family protein [Deltaproteobacteria bacterium]|nr:polysaccharide deacetylase family protein [Deltaproteobacteria bacterium]
MNPLPQESTTALNLLFHVVMPNPAPGAMSTDRFGELLESLLRKDLKPGKLGDYPGRPPGPGCFTVSFDDAHPSLVEHALPVLRRLNVPATVFVPTAYVGETDQVLDYSELKKLARLPGWEMGAHGHRHVRAGWKEYSEDTTRWALRLEQDYLQAREALAKGLGQAPRLLAYPFGEAPGPARAAAMQAGYAAAFTVDMDTKWDGTPWAVPRLDATLLDQEERRIRLHSSITLPYNPEAPPEFSIVVPAFGRLHLLREVVRRLHEQSYPEDRYQVIVVDDGSKDDISKALGPWMKKTTLLRLDGSNSRFRAGQARQAGADVAQFDHLAFLDADVAVDKDYLWHLAWCHASVPDALVLGYLSGYNLHDLGHFHSLEDVAATERLNGEELPIIPDRSREPLLARCLDNVAALDEPWHLAYTGNLSLPKDLLTKAGGFAKNFKGWGFEDVDLGLRLHQNGANFIFSRFALGYHMDDGIAESSPSNPFRNPEPTKKKFAGVLENLKTLELLHPDKPKVNSFCEGLRADVEEICSGQETVGVECAAAYPMDWPFARLHKRQPGGLSFEDICDRLAYAQKLGAKGVYLLGGDVLLRPDLAALLETIKAFGIQWITAETTGLMLAERGMAKKLRQAGLTSVIIEVLAGHDHPTANFPDRVALGVEAARKADIKTEAKLVLGEDSRSALLRGFERIKSLNLKLNQLVLLEKTAEYWVKEEMLSSQLSQVALRIEPQRKPTP